MAYRVERTKASDRDLELLFDFLFQAAREFGESLEGAFDRAAARVAATEDAMESLGKAPHQGTLRPELLVGLRSVTKDRAIFYFIVDDESEVLRILAVFFGGQDHQRLMLLRLLGSPEKMREALRMDTLKAWEEFQETRLHATAEEVDQWLESWGTENELPAPECHT